MIMNNTKFIYVFSAEDKNKLLSLGYNLLKYDESQNIYVFNNTGEFRFSSNDMDFVFTSTLTF